MSDYKEILTSDRVYKKYKSIIPDTNVSIDDIIQKLSYFYKISKDTSEKGKEILEYYKHIDLLPFLYGIGNYNSMNVFSIYAHNYLLVFLVEMGFLGLLLLLFQFLFFIKVSRGQFLFVFVPFFVQVMSSTTIFIPHLYIIAAIIVYYSTYYEKDKNIIS